MVFRGGNVEICPLLRVQHCQGKSQTENIEHRVQIKEFNYLLEHCWKIYQNEHAVPGENLQKT